MIFTVGAEGFHCEEWRESFYPEDLPVDWCVDYYANEIPAVLIDACDFEPVVQSELDSSFTLLLNGDLEKVDSASLAHQGAELGFCHFVAYDLSEVAGYKLEKSKIKWCGENASSAIAFRVIADSAFESADFRQLLELLSQREANITAAYILLSGAVCTVENIKTAQIIADLLGN